MEPRNLPLQQARLSSLAQAARFAGGFFMDAACLGLLILAAESGAGWVHADWTGALLFSGLSLSGAIFLFRSPRGPCGAFLAAVGSTLRAGLSRRFRYGFGFDFREDAREPPFRLPAVLEAAFGALAAAACLFAPALPGAIGSLRGLSGTAFLVALGLLWGLLGVSALLGGSGFLAVVQTLRQEAGLRENQAGRRPQRRGSRAFGLPAVSVALSLVLVSVSGGRAAFLALTALAALHLALGLVPRRGDSPRVLLVHRETGRSRRAGLFGLEHGLMACAALWTAALLAASIGDGAVPRALSIPGLFPPSETGVSFVASGYAARVCAFLAISFLLPFTWRALKSNRAWLLRNPGMSRRKTLSTRPGLLPGAVPAPWRLRRTRRPPPRIRSDLDYDPARGTPAPGEAPPLRRTLERLDEREFRFLLDHFDFVAKRRDFYRGFSRLLKTAAGFEFASGGGFLVSPHHFFVEGMHRDDPGGPEGEARIVGPLFSDLWGLRTRQFLHECFTGMGVDILYFEDSIRWAQLEQVLDQAFEAFLRSDDKRPLRESDFRFLNGVRVFLEDLEPAREREKREGYPEPHFENLSRARVLIVCKDRGGERDPIRENSPDERVPLMAG